MRLAGTEAGKNDVPQTIAHESSVDDLYKRVFSLAQNAADSHKAKLQDPEQVLRQAAADL